MQKKSNSFLRIFRPTVGKLLIILMAAYFVFTFISIRDRVEVNYYEVEEGSLERHHEYSGLILRSEEIVYAQSAGNIYYYVANGKKVANGNYVYAIDTDGELTNYLADYSGEFGGIDPEGISEIRSELISSSRTFEDADFSELYDTLNTLSSYAVEYASVGLFASLSGEILNSGYNVTSYSSPKSGTVCYYTDGYEDISEENLTTELMDQTSYHRDSIKAGDLVGTDTAIYKLIDGEDWQIAFVIDPEDEETFKDRTQLTLSFTDKGFTCRADFRLIYGTDGSTFGIVDLDSYMVQFCQDRFVNFEIVTSNITGLKIPDKSITTKEFYIIPSEYMITDEKGNTGFYVLTQTEEGSASPEFVQTDIYSDEDDYCYIEQDESSRVSNGTTVVTEDQSSSYIVGPTGTLTGVYNINKGYTVFRRIEPPSGQDELLSSNGYTVVAKNTPYGLSTYDHIVLDVSSVEDGQLVYR